MIPQGVGTATTTEVQDLNPTSTYTLRIIAIKEGVESEPSDVLTVDTQAPGCTPKPGDEKKKCTIS